jgi:predicted RNA-binding protein with PUA domain
MKANGKQAYVPLDDGSILYVRKVGGRYRRWEMELTSEGAREFVKADQSDLRGVVGVLKDVVRTGSKDSAETIRSYITS